MSRLSTLVHIYETTKTISDEGALVLCDEIVPRKPNKHKRKASLCRYDWGCFDCILNGTPSLHNPSVPTLNQTIEE